MKETRLQSPGQEDPLEEGMATHSRVLAWRSPRTEEPGGTVPGVLESDMPERLSTAQRGWLTVFLRCTPALSLSHIYCKGSCLAGGNRPCLYSPLMLEGAILFAG
ncbi:unnamed protein product [Rangifer tarandus platyrhynchus]|uniref:Uncharacterized protein n=2 Tax=Rangifer tarandus platyrhynchus TaxID=3082113 RepID=A0AC59Z151_RANTA|nr:unnamed protein product [Rangifer tarandus platyrhynchus]